MNIRWRLSIVFIQLIALAIASYYATGELYTAATWFTAGLFSVIIGSQILEPFYSRPADVIGNTVICFLLYLTTPKIVAQYAWNGFLILLIVLFILAVFSSWFGTGNAQGKFTTYAKVAKNISTEATAVRIYSMVFWLSLIESYPNLESPFWIMGVAWAGLVALGLIDWQRIWETLTGKTKECSIEGTISPSRVIVSAAELPTPGSWITLRTKELNTKGVVISRIQRIEDVWGQVYVESQEDCEKLLKSRNAAFEIFSQSDEDVLGIADEGSSQENLVFFPNRSLEIGNVVSVQIGNTEVLYQIHIAKIQKLDIKGGSQLQTQTIAKQLGVFDIESYRMKQFFWVPNPGTAVSTSNLTPIIDEMKIPKSWLIIGHVKGTDLPVYIDTNLASEGHLAILGMTKMGKSTLATCLIGTLTKDRPVTILDQTGEYKSKRNIPVYTKNHDNATHGMNVWEPIININVNNPKENPVSKAYEFLKRIATIARTQYEAGSLLHRTILIEEAHQFVPEPQGLSFGVEKDDTQKIGALMMQIRKFGISVILISQRTAVVAKSALSQCENIIAFKSVDRTGLDYLDTISGQEISNMLPTLRQGEAVVFGPAFSCDVPVAIKVVQESENQKPEEQPSFEDIPPEFDDTPPEDEIPF